MEPPSHDVHDVDVIAPEDAAVIGLGFLRTELVRAAFRQRSIDVTHDGELGER
jgi:hypothetical protein